MMTTDDTPHNQETRSAGEEHHPADGERRAIMARLGKMAALTSPTMITLLMSSRASAESPPPDP